MHKQFLFGLLLSSLMAAPVHADDHPTGGYLFGQAAAPTGNEWQAPGELGYNKLPARALFSSFSSVDEARKVLPEYAKDYLSLDGEWRFHFSKNPDERPKDFFTRGYDDSRWDRLQVPVSWNMAGIQKDGTLKYGVPIYVNQWVIFKYNIEPGDWKKGVMREPPKNYTTYEYRNEVGSFRRSFDIPATWDGKEVYLNFDGVDSFFYLWINGRYVGFSKNSRNTARFDISPYINKGKNEIAVEVYRSSDGSFLEAQDMFRLPGIFRNVSVTATPKVHVADVKAIPAYTDGKGTVNLNTTLQNLTAKTAKDLHIRWSLYKNRLFADDNELVATFEDAKAKTTCNSKSQAAIRQTLTVDNVAAWTAEAPNVYVVVGELMQGKKVLETISFQTGFRTVEIKDTPASQDEFGLAGRYYYINGKPVKLKGVNRHDTNPLTGKVISREQMEHEIMLMKRANINHIRTSHYPNDPYFYYLCNKYGIYLESEANIESHEYFYGKASLSHVPEFQAAHVDRVMTMAHQLVNNPSIVIWSLGNEAGPGHNFVVAYDSLKAYDASRPVQYERNNDIVDMGSNQYPSIAWTRDAVKGRMGIKYPFHISEYAHSMGNAVGNLVDYWEAMESTNFFMGGAIWDWIDQSMYNYTKEGKRYLAYGGDFGDTPNDGQFVMNGIIFGDEQPKPQYYEVKKVYQYIGTSWKDAKTATLDVFNKNYYTDDLSGYAMSYVLTADGVAVKKGELDLGSVPARTHKAITITGLNEGLDPNKEYLLHIVYRLKEDMPWAKAGYIQAEEQLPVQVAAARPAIATAGKVNMSAVKDNKIVLSGKAFTTTFDLTKGTIYNLQYDGKTIIPDGCGPELNAFRAWVNNDNWAYEGWYANGLNNLQHKCTSYTTHANADGSVSVVCNVESQAPYSYRLEGGNANWKKLIENKEKPFGKDDFRFTTQVVYTIFPDGSIESESAITSNKPNLTLAKLGYTVRLPKALRLLNYYGRGLVDNYPDRKTGQMIGIYEQQDVEDEFVAFPKPQDTGNHQDTRWLSLAGNGGQDALYGALFVAKDKMSFSALPWSDNTIAMANHPHELPQSDYTYLHLDMAITGLGGNSCGQGGPLQRDRVMATPHTFGYMIRPMNSVETNDLVSNANVSLNGATPLTIVRDAEGNVTINANGAKGDIFYRVNGSKKAVKYTGPVSLREGGTISAWTKENDWLVASQSFSRIESIPLSVVFASSQESGEGDANHLTDGDPSTYWHTMYSVTVANHPHWVDFDCGGVKTIKGFTYLPRQDSNNGNIKKYSIQVSNDGKTWGKAVAEGEFENNRKEKTVLLTTPVKARFVRLTALSEQSGQDFATGAEFKVLEK
ncbi:glycoside hydrolase family 2 TIM barrel-domain containing protein [Prevotella jejuni]|uniref:glycoside hydrolase family 2 TIM barrel-domain containing protein n=1 Tax=Prevotella jejuni TaxID=1177574 RepID=UPI001C5FE144|nr:glycoside hydrolase family 2 TIM barrel-domain containing protein [Prevotella jejuni]MBW4772385.1 discoidin domain-containing protein [Prevotella jejuni]